MTTMLEVERMRKTFGGVIANNDVSLSVPAGGIIGLIGPNGSGKTTLFNSIVGHHPIDAGSIRFEGREISRLRVPEIARLGLLRTFQQTRIYGEMNCVQNMLISDPTSELGCASDVRSAPRPGDDRRPSDLLEFVGLFREASPARRQPLLRPAETARAGDGADERARAAAARRAHRRHQPDAHQWPHRPPAARNASSASPCW